MGRTERTREIARRRTRSVKLRKLRDRYAKATGPGERQEIAAKIRRVSPFVVLEETAAE